VLPCGNPERIMPNRRSANGCWCFRCELRRHEAKAITVLRPVGEASGSSTGALAYHPTSRPGRVLMATGLAKSVDAAKTLGRGRPERWFFLTNRSLFHWIHNEPAPRAYVMRDTLHGEANG
jgi:hypothetical protein